MAKGQVTEEELATGLKSIGDFGALSGSSRVRRDNPFRDSRTDPPAPEIVKDVESAAAPASTRRLRAAANDVAKRPPTDARKLEGVRRPAAPAQKESGEAYSEPKAPNRKADIFTERVTLQMSPSMRDAVDSIARDFQRAKTLKGERITSNTVMRVAVQLVIEYFGHGHGDVANSEDELYTLLLRKLKLK